MSIMKTRDGDTSLIPPNLHILIAEQIRNTSILRTYGNIIQINGNSIQIPVHSVKSYHPKWIKEGENIQTNVDTKVDVININLNRVYLNFPVSSTFIEDMGSSMISHIESNASFAIGEEENKQLLLGSAKDSIRGILTYEKERVKSESIFELISKMYYGLHPAYRKQAIWITNEKFMSSLTTEQKEQMSLVRFDGTHNHEGLKIMGIPVVITTHDLHKDDIVLVNLHVAYLAIEKGDLAIIETPIDPFKSTLCFSRRMGGDIINPDGLIVGQIEE
jgi:HK97 family phage major capsid protein